MAEWRGEIVGDCLVPLSLGAIAKLQSKDYKPSGRYPIVDQGQDQIAGWTDDDAGVIALGFPVVVFGDHTRALKYVDFPFVRGADGTQVLRPRSDIDPLFFYYALKAIDLPSRGYNRHFKELKESRIALAADDEQRQISQVLRLVEEASSLQDQELLTLDRCKRATMRELFTRGLRGEAQKDTEIGLVPESWEAMAISDLGKVVTGNTPPTKDAENYVGGDIPFIAPGDVVHGCIIDGTEKSITQKGLGTIRPIQAGATCFVCIGSTIGKVGLASASICATNQQINSILPSREFDAEFVFHLMTYWSDHVRKQASPSPVPILSKGAFEQIQIYTTRDKGEQKEIANIVDAVDRKIDLHKKKRVVLDDLFKALLRKLMTGEIRVADLDLSALDKQARAEAS
ncbi:MAG TPA: restriction endonuclease subunit S [Hyphomicrobium sp.]|nr:restriction endonuclease subunit S [Hyphomicrobium sp.]